MSSLLSKYTPGVGDDIAPMPATQAVHDEDETVRWLTNFELSLEEPLVEENISSNTKPPYTRL